MCLVIVRNCLSLSLSVPFLRISIFNVRQYYCACHSYRLSVCLSVCPSVTCWYCIKTAEHIVMLSSPHDSPFILVLSVYKIFAKFRWGHPCGGAKQRWYTKMSQFSTNNLLYQKWLKIDGYTQRGILQALNPLSSYMTFIAIVAGAYPWEAKMF